MIRILPKLTWVDKGDKACWTALLLLSPNLKNMAEEVKTIIENEVFYCAKNKNEKLSFEFCKKMLNQNGMDYADDEVKIIVDYLYQMAAINLTIFKNEKNKIINLTEIKKDEKESYPLYQSEYRRAS